MFRHYLKTAIRNLLKRKFYTATNIFGLAVGLAMCLLAVGHIVQELSFDNFQENRDNIYRLESVYSWENERTEWACSMAPLGTAMAEELPEVESAAVFRIHQIESIQIGEERERIINEFEGAGFSHGKKLIFADPTYFDVFTYPLVQGDPKVALSEPNTVLVTPRAIDLHFGGHNPVGQMIRINDQFDVRITGILENTPQNTQLYTDFIVSYSTLERVDLNTTDWGDIQNDYVYLLLKDGVNPDDVAARIPAIARSHMSPDEARKYTFSLMPLKDIYFSIYGAGKSGEVYPAGEASMIYTMIIVAAFVLLLAIANFVNLSTARAVERTKEVGVRKVFGASRSHLVKQYLGESVVIAFISMLFGVVMYEVLKVLVETSVPRQYFADFHGHPLMWVSVAGLILVVGVLAGSYPAFYLSRFRPTAIFQSTSRIKSSKSLLRRVLVVFQFGVAAVFVFCTVVILQQLNHMQALDMGFDRENIMLLDFDWEDAAADCALMKNEIVSSGNAVTVTASDGLPGRGASYHVFYSNEDRLADDRTFGKVYAGDFGFVSNFGLQIVQGRSLSEADGDESGNAILLTETSVASLELENPIGTKLYGSGDRFYEVVGVVKDFHSSPAAYAWDASRLTGITYRSDLWSTLAVKLPADDVSGSIAAIQAIWERTLPGYQFAYTFMDDEIEASLSETRSQSRMFLALAGFTISIACLGIFGLVAFAAAQRTKEIGIRKVLGSSVANIVSLLSREFIILTAIANVIALPVATMMMNDMLRYFAVRTSIGPFTYVFVMTLVMAIALGTTEFQSVRAALANPVDSLRCE